MTRTIQLSLPLAICTASAIAAATALAIPAPQTSQQTEDGHQQGNHSPAPAPGYGSDSNETNSAPAANPTITISQFTFSGDIRVRAGQEVRVENADGAPHSLTATDGSFDTGVFDGGSSATFTAPSTAGSYSFSCLVHPSMKGNLVVEA